VTLEIEVVSAVCELVICEPMLRLIYRVNL